MSIPGVRDGKTGTPIYGVTCGVPDPELEFPYDTQNEHNARLDRIAGVGDTLIYEYDFGDSWEHDLKVEKVLTAEPAVR